MSVTTGTSSSTEAEAAMVADLRASLRGEVIDREHGDYDQARQVWNGLIDRNPAVIARCAGTADVVEAVRVAREHRPEVSIRGGGHQVAGSAVCDDGLVIDLSTMKGVHVDPVARTVRVQGGATWGDVDRETQLFGLITPGGEVSTTGVAGFSLGGGMGFVMRRFGLACDNLRSIEIVTADGMVRTASSDEHRDLWWAARGGGRGLGVVTSFEFDLHPLGPEVATAEILYPYEDAERILKACRDIALASPETVAPEFGLWSVPPDPELPTELHGQKVVLVAATYAGPPDEADAVLAPLRELGTPLVDLSGTVPYLYVQSELDELFAPGQRYYWKSLFLDELTDEAIRVLLEWDASRPSPETLVVFRTLGGAIDRVSPEDSAYPHRGARFNLSLDGTWTDPGLDAAAIGWVRAAWDAMQPFSTGGVYVNFSGFGDEADALRSAVQGASRTGLEEVRAAYDPHGLFEAAARRP
jgi:FAD/FMN-containing dehydrogenase